MKILYALISTIFIFMQAHGQNIDEGWLHKNYVKSEHMIQMRDSARLFTVVYSPRQTTGDHPILLTRTPYSCSPYGTDRFHQQLWTGHWSEYIKEGYIIVFQDVRGRYMSEGEFVDIRPFIATKTGKTIDEASDTYDTVEWLLKNARGNSGNVGVLGNSYSGFYAVMAALSHHPAIKAVNPQAPATDWFMGDDFHHNGALMLCDSFRFYSGFGQPRPEPTTMGRKSPQWHTTDEYTFFLRQGAIKNLTALLGDSIRFWGDMMVHPTYDKWWQERDHTRHCSNIKAAVLITGGLFDAEDLYGTLATYRAIATQSPNCKLRLALGPWSHGAWNSGNGASLGQIYFGSQTSRYYTSNIEIPFFNYYLKNIGELENRKPLSIFFTGENTWHQLSADELETPHKTPLYLNTEGKLSFNRPTIDNSRTSYISDPAKPVPYMEGTRKSRNKEYMTSDQRFAAQRPDVATFTTEPLQDDITVVGPLMANLKISISTTDADLIVKLIDIFPDDFRYDPQIYGKINTSYPMGGYMMLIRAEVMRGRFRNSFEQPEPFVPNQITNVNFKMPDIAHTFKRGHKIAVQIQSSWFPLVDRNPQQHVDPYTCSDSDFTPATITIYHQSDAPSNIALPIR